MQIICVIIFLSWHCWLAGIFPIQNVLIKWYILGKEKYHYSMELYKRIPAENGLGYPLPSWYPPESVWTRCMLQQQRHDLPRKECSGSYYQRDSKGRNLFISFKEGFPKDHLQLSRNVLNQLLVKFPAYQLLHAIRSGTLGTERLGWHLCNSTSYQQVSNFISMQLPFEMCLHLTNVLW
jgi:hypothetical protein